MASGYIDFFQPERSVDLPKWYTEGTGDISLTDAMASWEKLGEIQALKEVRQARLEKAAIDLEKAKAKEQLDDELRNVLSKYRGLDAAAPEIKQLFTEHGEVNKLLKFEKEMRLRAKAGGSGTGSGKKSVLIGPTGAVFEYNPKNTLELAEADGLIQKGWHKPLEKPGEKKESITDMVAKLREQQAAEEADAGPSIWDRISDLIPKKKTIDDVIQNVGLGAAVDIGNSVGGASQWMGEALQNQPDWAASIPFSGPLVQAAQTVAPELVDFGKSVRRDAAAVESALPELQGPAKYVAGAGRMIAPMLIPGSAVANYGLMAAGDRAGDFLDKGVDPATAGLGGAAEGLIMSKLAALPIKGWQNPTAGIVRQLARGAKEGAKMGTGLAITSPSIESAITGEAPPPDWMDLIMGGATQGAVTGAVGAGVGAATRGFGEQVKLEMMKRDVLKRMQEAADSPVPDAGKMTQAKPSPAEQVVEAEVPAVVEELLPMARNGQVSMGKLGRQPLPDTPGSPKWNPIEIKADVPAKSPGKDIELSAPGSDMANPIKIEVERKAVPEEPAWVPEPTAEEIAAQVPEAVSPPPSLENVPVMEVPRENLAVMPELMQYKAIDDQKTGTNATDRIKGENWNDVAAGNIITWVPNDATKYGQKPGTALVADGHHRVELGDRVGREVYRTQPLREADGYSLEDARATAAEANILNDKGTVYDQAKFLRNRFATHGKDAALARARQAGYAGRKASTIAILAEDNLYQAFVNQRISPEQAEQIAKAAPNNDAVQRLGLKMIADAKAKGEDVDPKELYLTLANWEYRPGKIEGDQQDMFGSDDSAIERARKQSQIVASLQQDLQDRISAIQGAANRPEKAKAGGVVVEDINQTLANVQALKEEKARLNSWRSHPDLKEKVMQLEAQPGIQESLFKKRMMSEAGIVANPFGEAQEGLRWLSNHILRSGLPSQEEVNQLAGEGSVYHADSPDSEKYFRGNVKLNPVKFGGYRYKMPMAGTILSEYRKKLGMPETVATKFPEARPVKTAGDNLLKREHSAMTDLVSNVIPFLSIKDTRSIEKIHTVLREQRKLALEGKALEETTENFMKLGLSKAEADAALGLRAALTRGLGYLRDGLLADPPEWARKSGAAMARYETSVAETIDELSALHYVPLNRRGNTFVLAPAMNGKEMYFSLHQNGKGAKKAIAKLKRAGRAVVYGDFIRRPAGDIYNELPPELVAQISEQDNGAMEALSESAGTIEKTMAKAGVKAPPMGFAKHLIKAKLVEGESADLRVAIQEYILGLSRWYALKKSKAEFNDSIGALEGKPALKAWAEKYKKDIENNDAKAKVLRKYISAWYLSRIMSSAVNATQSVTMTLPEMINRMGFVGGTKAWLVGSKLTAEYLKPGKKFAAKYPELSESIKRAEAENIIASSNTDALRAKRGVEKEFSDYALTLFAAAEKLNKLQGFVTGWQAAKSQKLDNAQAYAFGEKIAKDTQFDLTTANRPSIARGWGALPATFQLFSANWVRALRNKFGKSTPNPWGTETSAWKGFVTQIGMMQLLGGALALPLVGGAIKALQAMGYDPVRTARQYLTKAFGSDAAEPLLYGVPTLGGVNASGSFALSELAPGAEQGVVAAVGRLALGVAADLPQRVGRAAWLYSHGHKREAKEQLMPPQLRNMAEAQRWYEEDAIRSPATGELLVDKPTGWEIAVRSMGGTPPRLARAYERRQSLAIENEASRDKKDVHHRIAWAIHNKDLAEVESILAEIEAHNASNPPSRYIDIKPSEIKKQLEAMDAPGGAIVQRASKQAWPEMAKILAER